jgi:uncharacterized DUF497 family protein
MAAVGLYAWDERKRASNLRKHGVDFAIVEGFDFETAIVLRDDRKDYDEARLRAYGAIKGRLYALAFTHREGKIRVISLRKSNAREIAIYAASKKSSSG